MMIEGKRQRFCQQCGRFHDIGEAASLLACTYAASQLASGVTMLLPDLVLFVSSRHATAMGGS